MAHASVVSVYFSVASLGVTYAPLIQPSVRDDIILSRNYSARSPDAKQTNGVPIAKQFQNLIGTL